jgi:hypothetical protein
VGVFLKDDKLLFLPKSNEEILKSIQDAASKDKKMYFNVLEVGMYEQMIESLRPQSPEEEAELEAALCFVMDNSRDLRGVPDGLQPARKSGGGHPESKDQELKDSKGRLIKHGCHRDINVPSA